MRRRPGHRVVADERSWGVEDWGTTEAEEFAGENLDGRLARELPDGVPDEGDGLGGGGGGARRPRP